jgi:hypothetical protein
MRLDGVFVDVGDSLSRLDEVFLDDADQECLLGDGDFSWNP